MFGSIGQASVGSAERGAHVQSLAVTNGALSMQLLLSPLRRPCEVG